MFALAARASWSTPSIQPALVFSLAPLVGAIELTSGVGVVISIIVLGSLFVLRIFSLFLLVADSTSVLAEVIWAILLFCVGPLATPACLVFRHHRHATAQRSASQ